jgi:serine/threonine protein kinase
MEVDNLNPLPAGTRLQEFVIERLIGIGGFGIVYQANDTLLHRTVAIKEYMPTSLASRTDGATVSIRSSSHSQDFETGKLSFINEARMLARFKHAALIEVFRFWEQNSTAYMATPFYEGSTLKERLRETGSVPDEATLQKFLLPVLDALDHMHKEQIYHRDISPDNYDFEGWTACVA